MHASTAESEQGEKVADASERVPPQFVRKGMAVLGIALLGILLITVVWLAAEILLVAFAGILLGVFLVALRDLVVRWTPLSEGWSLLLVLTALLAITGAGVAFLVPQLAEQIDEFRRTLPEILRDVERFLEQYGWGRQLMETVEAGGGEGGEMASGFTAALGAMVSGATYLVGILFIGLFIAINPRLYTDAVIHMVPVSRRARAREVLADVGHSLRWFLVARAIAMLLVGVSTAIALLLMGIPLALLLGVIAGTLTFVPYLGPVLAAFPILAISLLEGPTQALWVLVVYTIIQQIEGNIFDPLILQRVVHLPPAITVGSQLMGSALLGMFGLALATPFAAVMQVIIRRVYREDVLGESPEKTEPGGDQGDDEGGEGGDDQHTERSEHRRSNETG
jgi:predicted PurR-regulated permease PerM